MRPSHRHDASHLAWRVAVFEAGRTAVRPYIVMTTLTGLPLYDLHHVGIVVADIDAAVARYDSLGFGDGERFEMTEQGVIVVAYKTGSGYIELMQPTDPDGAIARFMAKRGEGMHHVAYRVDDLQANLDRLAAASVRLIDTSPRRGAHGWRIAFIHPESCNGVLTELVETDQETRAKHV